MIKGSMQEEDITIINIYTTNTRALLFVRQILTGIKGEIDSNTIIVGDFTSHFHHWTDHPDRSIRKHRI